MFTIAQLCAVYHYDGRADASLLSDCRSVVEKIQNARILDRESYGGDDGYTSARKRGRDVRPPRRDLAERCPRTRTDRRPSDGHTSAAAAAAVGYFHIIYTLHEALRGFLRLHRLRRDSY